LSSPPWKLDEGGLTKQKISSASPGITIQLSVPFQKQEFPASD